MIGQRFGSYMVVRQVGEGSMGTVFEAVHEQIGRRVAIKLLKPRYSQDPSIAARFLKEARAASIVQHPGVVSVYDFCQGSQGAYLVMEYLEGESLRARLERLRKLGQQEALRLGRQLALTLAAAHQKGIVHRDLKPENVMLVPEADLPGGERAKVLDFGIAKVVADGPAQSQTQAGMLLGTPVYMAPEQCRGELQVDERADVYALGVMLYELLSGEVPFTAETPMGVMLRHLTAQPRPVREIAPEVPAEVAALVERMLAKEAAARPGMLEVAREAERLNLTSSPNSPSPTFSGPVARAPTPPPTALPASVTPRPGGAAFLLRASAPAIAYNYVLLDNPLVNGDPGALLLATPNCSPSGQRGAAGAHNLGVWYRGDGLWSVYHQDLAPMPEGAAFNLAVTPAGAGFLHRAEGPNIVANWTLLDHPETNLRPGAVVLITPNWSPPGQANVYNDHATGVWFTNGRWSIYNQDRAQMPVGAAFNVVVPPEAFVHRVTQANLLGGSGTVLDHPAANGRPGAVVLITANWNPGGLGGTYHDHPVGVYYTGERWAIISLDMAPMPVGAAFNVWVWTP